MYNSHITSALLSFRTKGSFSFSVHKDCSNLFNERFDCNPLVSASSLSSRCCLCCNCCSCCRESSFGTHRVALGPSLVYGLRQSSLIKFLPSRRFILGVRDRGYCQISGYGVDHGGEEVSCSFKQKRGSDRIKKEKFKRVSSSERRCLSGFDDVDAVISLLSEECIGDRERNVDLSKRWKMEKGSNSDCKSCRERKKNAGLGLLESTSKCEYESITVESRNEARRTKEERENREQRESREEREEKIATLKNENHRRKQSNASLSSYYSLSSAEDFESEREGKEESGSFVAGSTSEYREDTRNGMSAFEGRVVEKFKGHKEGEEKHGQVLHKHTSTARTNVDSDLRKKSEKKLSDSEEMQYSKESSLMHARKGKNFQSDYKKSSLQKQIMQDEEKSNVFVGSGRKTQYDQTINRGSERSEFRRNYKEINDMQETHGGTVETSSHRQKHISSREEDMTAYMKLLRERRDERHREIGKLGGQEASKAETQRLTKWTDTGVIDAERVQRQDVPRLKIREEDKATSSQQFSGIQNIRDNYSKNNSTFQSEIRKNHERNSTIASTSGEGVQDQSLRTDQSSLRIQSEKGRQDVTNISVNVTNMSMLHSSDTTSINNSQNIYVTGSQAGVQHVDLGHRDKRSSQVVMMPPSPQLLEKNSMLVDSSGGITTQEITVQSAGSRMGDSEFSQGLLYGNSGEGSPVSYPNATDHTRVTHEQHLGPPISEDLLGSAHRLEESATYFVGEFIDEARNDVLTSRIQEDEASDAKLVYEGQKHKEKRLSQYSSEGLQLKDKDSRQSSGGSGVKGPSDEMWHVTDPSVQEPPYTEAAEGRTTSENTIARRSGGSLWSIISNIVRLSWGSRAETPKSAAKSGGKSTSNDSVRSETWFSGRDNDEISSGNGKGEKTSTLKEASSSHQLQRSRTSSHDQISDASGSKETTEQFERGIFSPSITQKSGSSSKRISSPSEEENLDWSESGKSSQIIPSAVEVKKQSVISLPSSGISRPIVQESSGEDETVLHGSGISERVERPGRMESLEVSGSGVKEAELKQRRLQRNKQVIRDRFDEWEDAYLRESEQLKIDEMYMREALLEAKKAADTWEVPVGAVLVHDGKIIARGYNLVEELRDSTAHAEMICIREASNQLRTWRLAETTLYVTLEPCPMCAGAILQARIGTLVWGAPNKLLGADGSWIRLFPNGGTNGSEATDKPPAPVHPFHPNMKIRRGILSTDCAEVMQQFFQLRRKTKLKKEEDRPPQPSCLPLANRPSKFLHRMHNIFNVMFCL